MEEIQGKAEVKDWKWGQAHTISFDHAFKGQSGILDRLINLGPYPLGGSMFTVNPTQYRIAELGNFETQSGASMRQIIDLSDIEKSVRSITTGQSGHFMSPHYADQVRLWLTVELHPTTLDPARIETEAKTRMSLIPSE